MLEPLFDMTSTFELSTVLDVGLPVASLLLDIKRETARTTQCQQTLNE